MDLSSSDPSQKQPEPDSAPRKAPEFSEAFKAFLESLQQLATPEEKLAAGLSFMRSSISQEGTPHFKEFWEARSVLLPFFRENLNPIARTKLWAEYVELTVEARRLKEILEEQSAFAIEQIELAIEALSSDVENFDQLVGQIEPIVCPQDCQSLLKEFEKYEDIQKELSLLNALAGRLSGLRKEVLKTDMRMRNRSKIFKKLSELGDLIFPRRKERIEAISLAFSQDVAAFASAHFGQSGVRGAPHFALREEIKALQNLAKVFTLSSKAFNETRLELSRCWDQLREVEKERRKEIADKRQASSEQKNQIQQKLDLLKGKELSEEELHRELEPIQQEIRSTPLDREDLRHLYHEIDLLRQPHLAEQEKRAREAEEAERERLKQKKEQGEALKKRLQNCLDQGTSLPLEELQVEGVSLEKEGAAIGFSKMEKQQWDRQIRSLRNLIAEKKEEALLSLSDDDKKALETLYLVLQQKKERRQEIKAQLEIYRKTLGASGLDFEKAMEIQELAFQEKESLQKVDEAIQEVERKIAELEGD